MNLSLTTQGPFDGDVYSRIVDALRERGYIILDEVFPLSELQAMFIDIKQSPPDIFHSAGIGREQDHQLNPFVRRDRICWLDESHQQVTAYLQWIEQLRLRLNRDLFLGLFDYECHYAHYPKGAFYKKHYDAFRGSSLRRLTTILYLNPDWQVQDGGALLMYDTDGETLLETVLPSFGKTVIFLSEDFAHEVQTTQRSRYSLTGWFRINNNLGAKLDLPA